MQHVDHLGACPGHPLCSALRMLPADQGVALDCAAASWGLAAGTPADAGGAVASWPHPFHA